MTPVDRQPHGTAEGGGIPPDEATQRWWELYGTVRWALLCRRQAARYLSDSEPSIEFAVLGRRVCEQEYDVLLALGYAAPLKITDPLEDPVGPATAPHDRPTGPGLLRAAREFLTTEVAVTDPRLHETARSQGRAGDAALKSAVVGKPAKVADALEQGQEELHATLLQPGNVTVSVRLAAVVV